MRFMGGAHPRSRGENSMLKDRLRYEDGSSPLTRGKQTGRDGGSRRTGLIPAHAGKTSTHEWVSGRWWAHPRSRGENRGERDIDEGGQGSSPLTRGKPGGPLGGAGGRRLIPAHAGKTSWTGSPKCPSRAHPRSRGENRRGRGRGRGVGGSSPLTRGKHGCGR